jgi:hypothetical protein
VCSPRSFAAASSAAVNRGCSSGSPPLTVNPPPAARMNRVYLSTSDITSSTVDSRPSRMCRMSGLWQ